MIDPRLGLSTELIAELCRRYRVRELAVFGSAVKGNLRPESDVDFLVEFQPDAGIGFAQFMDLQDELARMVGRHVDLVSRSALKPLIRREILESREVLYAS